MDWRFRKASWPHVFYTVRVLRPSAIADPNGFLSRSLTRSGPGLTFAILLNCGVGDGR